jgi:hypothetical protein
MVSSTFHQDPAEHVGKTVARIESDAYKGFGSGGSADVVMATWVKIHFTDGTSITLGTDWRGRDCYISQTRDK